MKFNTKTIHGGQSLDPSYNAVMPPIYQTSTYAQKSPGDHKGYEYSRTHNPTRTALEKAFASIENANYGLAFASGLAAIDAVIKLLKPGDEVISTNDLYGGTYRLFVKIFSTYGIKFHFVGMNAIDNIEKLINKNTRLIWTETPTNPMLSISDISALSCISKKHKILLAVDNTFATPVIQKPATMGVDIILHSATKYFGGHSDICAGAVATSESLKETIWSMSKNLGGSLSDYTVWLLERSMKTLAIRVKAQQENAMKLSKYLYDHSLTKIVYYPGLSTHNNHDLAKRQMNGFGAMMSFEFDESIHVNTFLKSLKLIKPSMSLAGVESTMLVPAETSHHLLKEEDRVEQGITNNLIRFSVGIEDIEDLIEDIEQALKVSKK